MNEEPESNEGCWDLLLIAVFTIGIIGFVIGRLGPEVWR